MRARGFTLVEMLVTLTVTALVTGLLWQALATVARLETTLQSTRVTSDQDALRRAWIERAIGGLMVASRGDPLQFHGDARRLAGYSTMPPQPGVLGPEPMSLAIEDVDGGAAQRLLARRPPDDTPLELWRWPGRDGRFDYLGADGRWRDRWPAGTAPAHVPPLAVRLRGPATGPVLVPVAATANPMLLQRELLPDDAPPRR